MPASKPSPERRKRYRAGHTAERLAALYLIATGHRILARRYRTPSGEIDLIARRGRRIAFIEVKYRKTLADCEAAITPRLRHRVRRAANIWLAENPVFQQADLGFDLIFMRPRTWPVRLPDAL